MSTVRSGPAAQRAHEAHDTQAHHAERQTRLVALITAATMVVEIVAGWWFNSMALLADGWHMGTHASAIGLSALAYALARRWRSDPHFAFGPWKVEVLAAFASAVALLAAAVGIAAASVERLVAAQPIRYQEAIVVAVIGLVVNLLCAWLLGPHDHGTPHDHGGGAHHHLHGHDHHHHAAHSGRGHADLNLRSAYLHVLADAATSALAIVALAAGLWLGLGVLDPLMGLVGAAMVARWGVLLVRDTAKVLLDREMDEPWIGQLRHHLEHEAPWAGRVDVVALRLWRVGRDRWHGTLRLRSRDPGVGAARVRRQLVAWPQLSELVIEVEMQ
jgi:cation diffusion facilitator family transporter